MVAAPKAPKYHNTISTEQSAYDAFISYSRRDKEFVRRLHQALERSGHKSWVDWQDIPITANWWNEIEAGIESADTFIFVISPHSVASEVCGQEIDHAVKHNKRLVPIVWHDNFDDAKVHAAIKQHNWLFFKEEGDFDTSFQSLLNALTTDLEHVRSHTRLLRRAVDWQHHHYDASLLLRGAELEEAEQWLVKSFNKDPAPADIHLEYIPKSRHVQKKRQRLTSGVLLFFILILSGLLVFANDRRLFANEQRRVAEQERLIADEQRQAADEARQKAESALAREQKALESEQAALAKERDARELAEEKQAEAEAAEQVAEQRRVEAERARVQAERAQNAEAEQRQIAEQERNRALQNLIYSRRNSARALASLSEARLLANEHLESLVAGMRAGRELLSLHKEFDLEFEPISYFHASASLQQAIARTQERNRLEDHNDIVYDAKYSPNGQWIASGSWDESVILWNRDGTQRWKRHHNSAVMHVGFSADNQTVLSASFDGEINIWNLRGEAVDTFDASQHIMSLAADATQIVVGSDTGTIRVLNVTTHTWTEMPTAHEGRVNDLVLTANGDRLLSAGEDGTLRLWDIAGRRLLATHHHAGEHVAITRLSHNAARDLVISGDSTGKINVWQMNGQSLRQLDKAFANLPQHRVTSLKVSPDGQQVMAGDADGQVKVWRVDDGALTQTLRWDRLPVRSLEFAPNQQSILTSGDDRTIRLWKLEAARDKFSHDRTIYDVRVSPEGNLLASVSGDRMIKLWTLPGMLLRNTLDGHEGTIFAVEFSPTQPIIASASSDHTIKLWRVSDGALLRTLTGHDGSVLALSFSPTGRFLASAGADQTVRIWDVSQQTEVQTFSDSQNNVNDVAFSPDGRVLAYADEDGVIALRSTSTGALLHRFRGHDGAVQSLAFSPNGERLASASIDKTIKLWSVRDGESLAVLRGHDNGVNRIEFSPRGDLLASASSDATVKLWSVRDHSLIHTLNGHELGVMGLAFLPDGRALFSGGKDKALKFWNLNLVQLLNDSCRETSNFLRTSSTLDDAGKQLKRFCDGGI
jgi:WD40 repeat protein